MKKHIATTTTNSEISYPATFTPPTGLIANYIHRLMAGVTASFPWSVGTQPGDECKVFTCDGQLVITCHSPERAHEYVGWVNESRIDELKFPPHLAQA